MKKTRKGFTIVELVIVIAVIAVLAAILIPTFIHLHNKANEAADKSLVTNLNKALAMREAEEGDKGKNMTMHDCVVDLEKEGYRLPQLATRSDEDLVWSQQANRFFLSTDYKEEDHGKKYNCWHIYEQMPTTEEWAIYPNEDKWTATDVTVTKVGFDAGKAEVKSVLYKGEAGNTVVIRTTGASLEINAKYDTVNHYGDAKSVDIIAVDKQNSYHEFGRVAGYIKLTYGHFVAENGSETTTFVVDAASSSDVDITVNQGSSVGALIDFNGVVPETVSDNFEYVVTKSDTDNTVEEIISSSAYIETNGKKVYYDGLQEALNNASNGEIVVLTNDVTAEGAGTLFTYQSTTEDRSATLDLNGKIIRAKLENTASCEVIKVGSVNADEEEYQHTASLTVMDSNAPAHSYKTGAIIATPDRYSDSWDVSVSTFKVQRLGSLTVDSGKILIESDEEIVMSANADNPYAIDVLTNTGVQTANLTVNGGYISSDIPTGVGIRTFCNSKTAPVNLTINDGYIYGDSRAVMLQWPSNNARQLLECVINGGKLESATRALDILNFNSTAYEVAGFNITVNGGSFISHNDSGRVKFPGSDILYVSYNTNIPVSNVNFVDNRK